MNRLRKLLTTSLGLIFIFAVSGCKKPVEACFEFAKSESNFYMINFTSDCSEGAVAYEWEFGDGTTSIAANPSHSYMDAGEYSVTLRITSEKGEMSTTTQGIIVEEQCVECICYEGDEVAYENEICGNQEYLQAFCQSCLSFSSQYDCTCE